MKLAALVAIIVTICTPLAAQMHGPALYDVVGVATDDVLQIRSGPDADSESIGSLRPDAQGIEVTAQSADGKWARINNTESSGWVALRYLRQRAAWADGTPFGLVCSGTEPFWGVRFVAGYLEVSDPYDSDQRYRAVTQLRGAGTGFADLAILGGTEEQPVSMIVSPAACNDGMSDRNFALQVQLLRPNAAAPLLSGCCSMVVGQ